MKVRHTHAHLTTAACLLLASPAAPHAAGAPQAWNLDYGERRCTLLRKVAVDEPTIFGVRIIPGNSNHEVVLTNPEWKRPPIGFAQSVDIMLKPSNLSFRGRAFSGRLDGGEGHMILVDGLESQFLDRFSESAEVVVSHGTRVLATVPLPGTKRAVQALKDCTDALYRAWGADPDLYKSLQKPPVGDARAVFKADDYPIAALRANSSGEAIIRYEIGPEGRVTACEVVAPSGDASLDKASCGVVKKRARFEPAIGPDGRPVAVSQIQTIVWLIYPN